MCTMPEVLLVNASETRKANGMNSMSWVVTGSAVAVSLLILAFNAWSLRVARESIFRGSGRPIGMARTLLSSVHVTSQMLFGVLSITLISLLMVNTVVTAEAGLPLVSAIIGYLLGKSFKDISAEPEKTQPNQVPEDTARKLAEPHR